MTFKNIILLSFMALTVVSLAGCFGLRSNKQILIEDGQYWQRSNSSSALYMRGPKAQQILARDISRCVVEVRELTHLHAIKEVSPSDHAVYNSTNDPDTPAGKLAHWESKQRDGYLRAENMPFQDFETCMIHKGWERVEYLPGYLADEARGDYIESIYGQQRRIEFERGGPQEFEDNSFDIDGGSTRGLND